MSRFFFHVQDGLSLPDDEGVELPNCREAQVEAIRCAAGVIGDNASLVKLGDDWSMDVTDSSGLVLFRLQFHIGAVGQP